PETSAPSESETQSLEPSPASPAAHQTSKHAPDAPSQKHRSHKHPPASPTAWRNLDRSSPLPYETADSPAAAHPHPSSRLPPARPPARCTPPQSAPPPSCPPPLRWDPA